MPVIIILFVGWMFFIGYSMHTDDVKYDKINRVERCVRASGNTSEQTLDKCKELVYSSTLPEEQKRKD